MIIRDLMKKKLILFDIDGTIIDHFKKEIPKKTIQALKELKLNNHKVAIATGKGPTFIKELFDDIEIDTFVALNGNYVVYNNEVIYKKYLDGASLKRFCEFCLANDLAFVVSDEGGTKTLYDDDERIREYYANFSLGYPEVITEITDYNSYFQMTIMVKDFEEAKVVPFFAEFIFVRMAIYGMNVVGNDGLKEIGIQKLLDHTHYTSDDLVVFGDGLNDIGMFRLAKTSIAMGNANPKLKDEATHITEHISDAGLYKACKKLELI